MGFNTTSRYYGQPNGISHDGTVVAGYMDWRGDERNFNPIRGLLGERRRVAGSRPAGRSDRGHDERHRRFRRWNDADRAGPRPAAKRKVMFSKSPAGRSPPSGFLGGTNQQTYATAINSDGTVVAGYYNLDNGNSHGFMWNATNGLTDMGIPANHPNTYYLEPTCISDDGTTVFGRLTEFNGWVGFRYNTTTGFQDIGGIAPSACTADGTEAVGIENLYFPASGRLETAAVIWTICFPPTAPPSAGDHCGAGHNFTRWLRHHGTRPGCLFDRPDLVWHLANFPAFPLENGGVSASHADLLNALPGNAQRAGRNADSICRIHHRRVRCSRHTDRTTHPHLC